MRSTSITFGLVAFFAASAVAAPTPNANELAKRVPTPEQFETLAPEEKREAYKAIYRATNIIGKSDAEKREAEKQLYPVHTLVIASDVEKREAEKQLYPVRTLAIKSDVEKREADKAIYRPFEFRVSDAE
jgi:16S rRNA C967 or C1407 C5-methylase (RsmB/RsmF family)